MQKTRVFAIGVKYLPSMPERVSIGKKTISIMSTAKVALLATLPAPAITSSLISSAVRFLPLRRLQ